VFKASILEKRLKNKGGPAEIRTQDISRLKALYNICGHKPDLDCNSSHIEPFLDYSPENSCSLKENDRKKSLNLNDYTA